MTMLQKELLKEIEGGQAGQNPIVFECFSSYEAVHKSFGGMDVHWVDAGCLNEAVERDLERIGLLSVVRDEQGRRDEVPVRRKRTGLVDEELSRQPSKGKIYGRKVNGRFASKAIYNYHTKKKALGVGEGGEERGCDEVVSEEDMAARRMSKLPLTLKKALPLEVNGSNNNNNHNTCTTSAPHFNKKPSLNTSSSGLLAAGNNSDLLERRKKKKGWRVVVFGCWSVFVAIVVCLLMFYRCYGILFVALNFQVFIIFK